jgi:hypothetical protein
MPLRTYSKWQLIADFLKQRWGHKVSDYFIVNSMAFPPRGKWKDLSSLPFPQSLLVSLRKELDSKFIVFSNMEDEIV